MAWILLIAAGLFEIAWAVGLKFTDGFTRLGPTLGTVAALVISFAQPARAVLLGSLILSASPSSAPPRLRARLLPRPPQQSDSRRGAEEQRF